MKKWLHLPVKEGQTARQAHCGLPDGTYEREMGVEGFFGPATHFYHKHPPTAWVEFKGDLQPRAFDTNRLTDRDSSPWNAIPLLHNASAAVRYWQCDENMPMLVRNADGDDLLFFHAGKADFYSDFGRLPVSAGDYLLIPRGTLWRLEVHEPVKVLMIEASNDHYRLPDKGLLGEHAIVDPAVFRRPAIDEPFLAQQDESRWQVQVKKNNRISRITYPFNPLDAIGWQGTLTPVALNWRDIRPLMSHRYHLPPSVHSTFVANRFVVCTFVPRPFETDPDALKVPFFHNNDDYDEVLFYHQGDFFSRDNIHPGMMTFHPAGFTHGPHPKALKNAFEQKKTMTDEVAVMIDTRDPLHVSSEAQAVEWTDYVNSWRTDR